MTEIEKQFYKKLYLMVGQNWFDVHDIAEIFGGYPTNCRCRSRLNPSLAMYIEQKIGEDKSRFTDKFVEEIVNES